MKTIVTILRGCSTSMEMIACLIGIVLGYIFIAMVFFDIHWMCGVMSVFVTTSLINGAAYIARWIDKHGEPED